MPLMHGIDVLTRRRLHALDLNLLVALEALLATRSVTAAARALGRTQSATSHALARLRELLGDPLLVREGTRLVPTPRALELSGAVGPALEAVAALLAPEAAFEPKGLRRELVIACPDLLAPVVPALLARVHAEAPHARLVIEPPQADLGATLASGSCDLAIGAERDAQAPSVHRTSLGRVHFGVVAREGHPATRRRRGRPARPLSREDWLAWPHVIVRSGNRSPNMVQEVLDRAGATRSIGLVVPSFLAALHVVAETDLFFAAPREVVALVGARLDVEVHPLPIALPPIGVALFWHARVEDDATHRWLRTLTAETIRARLV
jgi:DNA-binding transcriptional LysR family regulator